MMSAIATNSAPMNDTLLGLFRGRRPRTADPPLRAELLSIERLEERAKALAASFTLARNPRRKARPFFSRLEDNARVLREAYRVFSDEVHSGAFIPPAAEWLLDNFHLIEGEIRDTRHDLPRDYYLQLPKLASREMAGIARVYAMALELIRHTDGRLERRQLVRFATAYQTVAPLTICSSGCASTVPSCLQCARPWSSVSRRRG